jgi:hypothetical protein
MKIKYLFKNCPKKINYIKGYEQRIKQFDDSKLIPRQEVIDSILELREESKKNNQEMKLKNANWQINQLKNEIKSYSPQAIDEEYRRFRSIINTLKDQNKIMYQELLKRK